jgi:ribonuclease-3
METGITIKKEDGTEEVYMIPYNINNILIGEKDIKDILARYNVNVDKINHIEYFYQAFTHKSYVKKDIFSEEVLKCSRKELGNPTNLLELQPASYERQEYFGDRVVKICVSLYLFHRYPHEDEGFMTRLQTKIEDKKNLAVLSKELGLGKYFIISKQIENLSGRHMDKIHEDVFEAFMSALFLSNGFEPCCLLLLNLLETKIDYSDKLYCDNNYKDKLLRVHHTKKWRFPVYQNIDFDGPPHKRMYIMGVENPNLSANERTKYINEKNYKELCISFGHGSSKKEGEQKAAKMALILAGVLNTDQYNMSDVYYPDFNKLGKSPKSNINDIIVSENDNVDINSDETDSEY